MPIEVNYDYFLVSLSFLISVFGAFTALQLAVRIPSAKGLALFGWLAAAAISMGGGAIWSMHFIAMLAYKTNMPVSYDRDLTILSLLIAIFVTGVGLLVVGRGSFSLAKLIGGGVFTGLGVASMHYIGMEAMKMQAEMTYTPGLFSLSIVIAIGASTAALWLAFNQEGGWQKVGSALVMGMAVCGMHYVGMASMVMTPNHEMHVAVNTNAIRPDDLALYIFVAASALLSLGLAIGLIRSGDDFAFEV